uniref:Uncharacterized protein n=1 Tax=Brassica oleracea TaxID=3712 RepID=A0A3P6GCC0_BRAOL|nr:unnamed protein product [Brassica oleracea]
MATTATSDAGEGPVMALINKRLRAFRKKLNRIAQMEESISQGKTLNKEQQEVLRSKPSVLVLIEELDKLRNPLSNAVSEEIALATTHHNAPSSDQNTTVAVAPEEKEKEKEVEKLEDLVNLLYFGSLFDVKSQNELASIMMTRTHERGCCLVYDTVTDESTADLLCDKDLDLISRLWGMMVSRPADSSLSHKNALERCVEHAKLWLANSDQPIASNCEVSYATLREKVKKIMGSNYFTITPEMVVAPVEATAEAGSYGSFQVAADSEQKEEDASNFKEQESYVNDQSEQPKDESVVTEGEVVQGQQEQGYTQVEGGRSKRDYQQQQYVPRGFHQNQRGHRGARRGHSNAPLGGRGGGGGYSNGRYESYDNSGGNGYQRSHYNNRGRGRGGGGNGHSYNNNHQDSDVSVAS